MDIYLPIAEMSVPVQHLIGAGLVVGLLSGLFGIGGGFLMTPFLAFMGLPAAVIVASQAMQQAGTSLSGALAQFKRRQVDLQMSFVLIVGSVVGTMAGVQLFVWLKQIGQINLVIMICYVSLLSIIGALMFFESAPRLFKKKTKDRRAQRTTSSRVAAALQDEVTLGWGADSVFATEFKVSNLRVNMFVPLGLGVMAGLLVSLLGVGGGFVMVPAMIYVLKMPPRLVSGTSLVQIVFASAISGVMHCVLNGSVDVILTLVMLLGSVMGVPLGARFSYRLRPEIARFLMAVLILGVAAMLLRELIVVPDPKFVVDIKVLP
ncbi:MAG: sulfite exporter TauE/SafE family protein [Alphaproteobacteria bacterium]|nr:sulfite exporter TauE/SafE family protein [Alphaproteobacteria bacterium]